MCCIYSKYKINIDFFLPSNLILMSAKFSRSLKTWNITALNSLKNWRQKGVNNSSSNVNICSNAKFASLKPLNFVIKMLWSRKDFLRNDREVIEWQGVLNIVNNFEFIYVRANGSCWKQPYVLSPLKHSGCEIMVRTLIYVLFYFIWVNDSSIDVVLDGL